MDIQELVVRATPEGMSDVNDGLESMERRTQETTDSVEDTTDELGSLSNRFRGAMTAIIAGLAVGTAGLLAQVPVVGETMSQLGTTIDIITLKIDQDLRPAFQGLQEDASDVNDETAETEGAIDALQTATNGWISAIQEFIAQGFQQKLKDLTGIDLSVETIKFLTVGGADPEVLASNIRAGITQEWEQLRQATKRKYNNITTAIKTEFNNIVSGAKQRGAELQDNITDAFDNTISDARSWGQQLIDRFIQGIENRVPDLGTTLDNIGNGIGSVVPGVGGGSSGLSGSGSNSTGPSVQGFIGSVADTSSAVFLDGSRVDSQIGRFRKANFTRRGI